MTEEFRIADGQEPREDMDLDEVERSRTFSQLEKAIVGLEAGEIKAIRDLITQIDLEKMTSDHLDAMSSGGVVPPFPVTSGSEPIAITLPYLRTSDIYGLIYHLYRGDVAKEEVIKALDQKIEQSQIGPDEELLKAA